MVRSEPSAGVKRVCVWLVFAVAGIGMARAGDWVELRTPYFRVISEASETRTREWGIEFELFRRGMELVMPVDPKRVESVTLVLFSSDRRLRPFKPMENGKPARMVGYFARAGVRKFIALGIEGSRDAVRELLFHEAVHWHLAAADRPRPLWLEEGLAEVFGNFRLDGDRFVIGAFRPHFMRHVQASTPLPFAKMMELGSTGLNYNGQHADLTVLFYQQSWLMVHELIFGTEGFGYLPLRWYLLVPPQHPDPMEDFARGMKIDPAKMDERLAHYLARGRFSTFIYPFDRRTVDAGFVLRRASDAEVDLTLGNLLVGAGRWAEAEPYLRRADAAMPHDFRAAEALGTLDEALSRSDDAAIHYAESIRRGGSSYLAHYFLGRHSLRETGGLSAGAPDAKGAVAHLVNCIRSNPRFGPAYESLALALPMLSVRCAAAEELIEQGASRFPASPKIQMGATYVSWMKRESGKAR